MIYRIFFVLSAKSGGDDLDRVHVHSAHPAVRLAVPEYQELFIKETGVASESYNEDVQSGVTELVCEARGELQF